MPRRLLCAMSTLAAAVAIAPGSAGAHNGDVLKGWGTPTIDGRRAPGEWDRAAQRVFPINYPEGQRPATLFVMNDGSELYLALEVERPLLGPSETVDFHFDNDHSGNAAAQGADVLRLSPPGSAAYPAGGAVDMYFDASRKLIEADTRDGGTNDVRGAVGNDGSKTFFELSHPLDTSDDAHDFSAGPHSRLGFAVSLDDCFCSGERVSGWPPPGPWADVVVAGARPSAAISATTLVAHWRESVLVESTLSFAGKTSDGGDLLAELAPSAGGDSLASTMVNAAAGPFSGTIALPPDLLPGPFLLRVTGASDGAPLAEVDRIVRLPAPREGIVRQVDVSASKDGPPIGPDDSLPAGAHELVVRFHFAVMPKQTCSHHVCKPRMTATTYSPGDTSQFATRLKRARVVTAGVGSSAALASGTWKVVLRVGGIPVKTALVRIG